MSCAHVPVSPDARPPVVAPTEDVNVDALVESLVQTHGEAHRPRIARGVAQVAALWRPEDGDLAAFAREQFLADPQALDATFTRLQAVFEQLDGHMNELGRELRWATDLDLGPLQPIDRLLASVDPSAHLTEDLFAAKVGFVVLLNFPLTTLEERSAHASEYTRRQWAEARLAGRFGARVPAAVQAQVASAGAAADLYIAEYNLWMHHILDERGQRVFPSGMRLISHWNLRDELKAAYADGTGGLARQRTIVRVMARIVDQTIPAVVINNPRVDWNPFTNEVVVAPAESVEAGEAAAPAVNTNGMATPPTPSADREPDTRYAHLLAQFHAARGADPYVPTAPTAIDRTFELRREIPEQRVVAMLTEVLTSPLVPRVGAEISRRLGRPLEPQDLWFNGFKPGSVNDTAALDAVTRARYPTADAFAADLPKILRGLSFSKERAEYLAARIRVDPARGAGHAMPALRRGDFPRLRTRVGAAGMDYKGYNIAIHELGHNVEQVFSLYEVDHTLLAGVPNNAFTEALAFVFQARDLELLGLPAPNADSERERVLNDFWSTWEIAGVALVDLAVWHWMYDHPDATPAELRAATVTIAADTWDRFYAPVLGEPGTPLLGIYSHMIAYPLYLADYPLGHLIAFQIEEHLQTHGPLGSEFERMARTGAITPDQWMMVATGAPVSPAALLRATERAMAR